MNCPEVDEGDVKVVNVFPSYIFHSNATSLTNNLLVSGGRSLVMKILQNHTTAEVVVPLVPIFYW